MNIIEQKFLGGCWNARGYVAQQRKEGIQEGKVGSLTVNKYIDFLVESSSFTEIKYLFIPPPYTWVTGLYYVQSLMINE